MTTSDSPLTTETEIPYQIPPHDQAPAFAVCPHCGASMQAAELAAHEQTCVIKRAKAIDEAVSIGERELAIAAELQRLKDQVQAQQRMLDQASKDVQQQQAENRRLEGIKDELTEDREFYKARVETLEKNIDALMTVVITAPERRKIEVKTVQQPTDEQFTALLNAGWRVAYEQVYSLPNYGAEMFHHVRLEREVQNHVSPPQDEARAAAQIPDEEQPPTESPNEPDDAVVVYPSPEEIVFHVSKPVLIPVMGPKVYEAIDPADIDLTRPVGENIARYGAAAVGRAQDLRIMAGMAEMKLAWSEKYGGLISKARSFQSLPAQR